MCGLCTTMDHDSGTPVHPSHITRRCDLRIPWRPHGERTFENSISGANFNSVL
jgi:hypothetical protein